MVLGLGCLTVGCLLLGLLGDSVWFYYVFWIFFVGFGLRFGTLLPEQVNISKWFFNYRGMAMALLLTAGGIGGYIFTPLCTKVNELFGWRYVWIMIAAFSLLSLLLTLIFVRESPGKYGLQVDGGKVPDISKKSGENTYKTYEPWKLRDARKTAAFAMLIFLYFAASYQLSIISSQAINHLELQGVGRAMAASAVGMFAFINTFGRVIVGVLGDRVDMKKIVAAGSILSAAGFLLLIYASNAFTVYASLILSGIGYGIVMVAPQNMLLNYFGSYDYANINGLYSMLSGVLAAIPPVVVGWVYDISGSYQFAWILGICLMAGCLLIAAVIRPPVISAKAKQKLATIGQEGERMKIAVLGAGATGSVFASYLKLGGEDVWLIDPYKEHMDAIARDGMLFNTPEGSTKIRGFHTGTSARRHGRDGSGDSSHQIYQYGGWLEQHVRLHRRGYGCTFTPERPGQRRENR